MNRHFRDRLSLSCAIVIGLGISTGHSIGIVAAAGMPIVCLAPTSRKGSVRNAFGYYVAALWPIVPGHARYLGQSSVIALVALWIFAASLLSLPWTVAWTRNRWQYAWRTPLALLATVIPPLGIIGLASPLTAAGYLFPGMSWIGLSIVALAPGAILATATVATRRTSAIVCGAVALCVVAVQLSYPGDIQPPQGWFAVNTHFGDVSQPFRDFAAAQFIQQTAATNPARVLIFPESVVPRWTEATAAFWHQTLDQCRARGQILAIGAGLPARTRTRHSQLSELMSYDFDAAIDMLTKMSPMSAYGVHVGLPLERTDNTLLIVGAESNTFYQRVPVPIGMWKPFDRTSVPLRLTAPGIVEIDHEPAVVLICYEQLITFPILVSMLQHPSVIVGISNTFWVQGAPISRFQATALRAWARLFHLPYLLATNS